MPQRQSPLKRTESWFLALLFLSSLAGCAVSFDVRPKNNASLLVLGIDGMDPRLLRQYMAAGKMPNFTLLARQGSFRELGTSTPPQSPVAWSNLITGTDPGHHGIFDFIHRDPATLTPYLSTSRTEPPRYNLRIGSWLIPLSGGKVELLRRGKAFWEILDEHDVPATIFKMPANFPPVRSQARTFAGMGTPDLLGTYGTFSFYTDDPLASPGSVSGGHVYRVSAERGEVAARLEGPGNPFRKGQPSASIAFTVHIDAINPTARVDIQDQQIVLQEGEWSGWVPVSFELLPYLQRAYGICRFYLKQVHPGFQLYVTPINLDPSRPGLPLSTPESYSRELAARVGSFYTQGIAEDTKAVTSGVLSEREYLQQARMVLTEQIKIFELELARFQGGLLFFYFSSLDQNSHMFWRAIDPRHPGYDPDRAAEFGAVLEQLYQEMDAVLGTALQKTDASTTLLVLSDHGFAPYYRSFNLNTWLLENGFLALKAGAAPEGDLFRNVDWSRTRAYGLGLNGLYLNLRGREPHGIVQPGGEREALMTDIATRLLALRDPAGGAAVIARADKASDIYQGPNLRLAPDLVLGYSWGYRAGWSTVLGGFAATALEDNTEAWSGDHCVDARLVPGVLLSNRKISVESPQLLDVAPTILSLFGIRRSEAMKGQPFLVN